MSTVDAVPAHLVRVAGDRQLGGALRMFTMGLSDGSLFRKYTLICVFEHGFVLGRPDDDAHDSLRWDEVARYVQRLTRKIVNGSYRSTTFDLEFQLHDGRTVSVVGVSTRLQTSGVEGFASIADALVTRAQVPAMLETLGRGEPVDFGALRVEADGIRKPGLFGGSGKHVPWDQVTGVDVQEGSVRIKVAGKRMAWTSQSVSGMANLGAFLTLVRLRIN